jgi:hypothetical protein
VEVQLEGAFPRVRDAFGMLLDKVIGGVAKEYTRETFSVPGDLIGRILGACVRACPCPAWRLPGLYAARGSQLAVAALGC